MSKFAFAGTGVALITPFRKQETIDFSRLETLINTIISSGVEYIVALGTTSEAATMSDNERSALRDFIIETTAGRVPVVLGMGGNNTRQIADTIAQTNFDGISGILSVAPFYNKPNQEGQFQYFKAVAAATDIPIIIYNVPGRTGANMLPDTVIRLANDVPNIRGIKEASGNYDQVSEIIRRAPEGFTVLSGDDDMTLAFMATGAHGVISVASNIAPKEVTQMVEAMQQGHLTQARELHHRLFPLFKACFVESNPIPAKAALEQLGVIGGTVRLPLAPASDATRALMQKVLGELWKK